MLCVGVAHWGPRAIHNSMLCSRERGRILIPVSTALKYHVAALVYAIDNREVINFRRLSPLTHGTLQQDNHFQRDGRRTCMK